MMDLAARYRTDNPSPVLTTVLAAIDQLLNAGPRVFATQSAVAIALTPE